jgi:hypothetical protein
MPSHSKPLAPADRGEKAGQLAASEMIKTLSPETGSIQGLVRRVEEVGVIVAQEHLKAGMLPAEVQAWHVGFQAGMRLQLGITCGAFDRRTAPRPVSRQAAQAALTGSPRRCHHPGPPMCQERRDQPQARGWPQLSHDHAQGITAWLAHQNAKGPTPP